MKSYSYCTRCYTGIDHRLNYNEPAFVIGNFRKNMLIHPTQNRGLSVREAARLRAFPDWFAFYGSIGLQQQQVGNAVPPNLIGSGGVWNPKSETRKSSLEFSPRGGWLPDLCGWLGRRQVLLPGSLP